MSKEKIHREITECRKMIEQYSKYEHELISAKDYCEQAGNGISLLMNAQYEKVKTNCIEAIGEEDNLLSALQVKHKNLYDIYTGISTEIQGGITGVQDKIEELREKLQSLLSML